MEGGCQYYSGVMKSNTFTIDEYVGLPEILRALEALESVTYTHKQANTYNTPNDTDALWEHINDALHVVEKIKETRK